MRIWIGLVCLTGCQRAEPATTPTPPPTASDDIEHVAAEPAPPDAEVEVVPEQPRDDRMHYNAATAYRLLGDGPQAVRYYELYLREQPDAKNRARVEAYIQQLTAP